jgi:hypothetical protein
MSAPVLAHRLYDDVRTLVPTLEPLPEPVTLSPVVEEPTLFDAGVEELDVSISGPDGPGLRRAST